MPDAWQQSMIVPPPVLEARIRLGVVGESDHLQALVEVLSATDGVLLAQESIPHASYATQLSEVAGWAVGRAVQLLDEFTSPF